MAGVFRTRKGGVAAEIANVGYLGPDANGGVPIDRAAELMAELQDGEGKPLTGTDLTAAAKKWADAHDLDVSQLSAEKITALPTELGAAPDRPSAEEVSKENYRAEWGTEPADPSGQPPAPAPDAISTAPEATIPQSAAEAKETP